MGTARSGSIVDLPNHREGIVSINSRAVLHRKSRLPRGNVLPRNGNILPQSRSGADDVAKAQGDVLQGVFGRLKSPAKEMANITGQNERACRNQLSGLNSMQLHKFFEACQTIPELQSWGAMMMGMGPTHPNFQKEMARGHQEIILRIESNGITLGGKN